MSTLVLPKSSKVIVIISIIAFGVALFRESLYYSRNTMTIAEILWLAVAAFIISGFLADLFTGLAHFGFDYVFPDEMPIMGRIAKEFREHHDCPTLDPSNYIENLTHGSYGSLLLSFAVCVLSDSMHRDWTSFAIISTLLGMSFWAFFFHQIHSYAHMGSCLPADEFTLRVAQISLLPTQGEQKQEFEKLFETVPIPPIIRFLQRYRVILNPETHNFHHITFESDFSSVNGWSDPIMNLIFAPIARRIKAKSQGHQV